MQRVSNEDGGEGVLDDGVDAGGGEEDGAEEAGRRREGRAVEVEGHGEGYLLKCLLQLEKM